MDWIQLEQTLQWYSMG